MTRTKLWRLSLAAILGFGWLFLTPAYSDDPLQIAAQQISTLQADVQKLNNKKSTQDLIDIAVDKYNAAVVSREILQNVQSIYDNALILKNDAQSNVDSQTSIKNAAKITKDNAYDAYTSAQIALDAHIATYGSSVNQGISFQIYPLSRDIYGTAYLDPNAGLICQGTLPYFYTYNGDGNICYADQNILGIFRATLTVPSDINDVYFAAYTDDGSKIYINGNLEASQWWEQGGTWGPYTRHFDTLVNKTLQLEVWWYNGGGPGIMTIGWGYNNIWTGIPTEYLSYGSLLSPEIQAQRDALQQDRDTKYNLYQSALATYNLESNKLTTYNQNLTTANQNLTVANQNLTIAQSNYEVLLSEMQNAIVDAQNEYNKQWKFEEQQRVAAAIAEASANQQQPSPTPEVTPEVTPSPNISQEPTPSPTPEQTKPSEPTPTPTPETTPSVKPTPSPELSPIVEPSPKPSSQPTDTNPTPTPEPTQDPVVSPDKTKNSPISSQMANLIADLTNSNTLTKLTPEQKAAVAGALGIKSEEIIKVAELAKSEPVIAKALEEFGNRANENLNAPMPYTLADATTEIATEQFLADPIGALTSIDLSKINFKNLGSDMTDDQREKAQEVVIPVIIASNIVAAAMTRRI